MLSKYRAISVDNTMTFDLLFLMPLSRAITQNFVERYRHIIREIINQKYCTIVCHLIYLVLSNFYLSLYI